MAFSPLGLHLTNTSMWLTEGRIDPAGTDI